jgi:hypothetical protein
MAEYFELAANTKKPGPTIAIDRVEMKFNYKDYFKTEPSNWLRDADLRLHDRRQHPVPMRRGVEAGWRAVPQRRRFSRSSSPYSPVTCRTARKSRGCRHHRSFHDDRRDDVDSCRSSC